MHEAAVWLDSKLPVLWSICKWVTFHGREVDSLTCIDSGRCAPILVKN